MTLKQKPTVKVARVFDEHASYLEWQKWSGGRDDGPHFAREWIAGQRAMFERVPEFPVEACLLASGSHADSWTYEMFKRGAEWAYTEVMKVRGAK